MKYKHHLLLMLVLTLTLVLVSCRVQQTSQTGNNENQLIVLTHDSFSVSEQVIHDFEQMNNTKVQFLSLGDAGTALNKVILSKDTLLGDVFYGVDNTFLSRAITEGIFESYKSPVLDKIPDTFKLDSLNQALPVDYGDVCPNYDIGYFQENKLEPPQNLEDLIKPAYKGLLAVENPATSSPGLAFLLATIGHFGEDGYLNYWQALEKNEVLIVNDWNTAYNTEFTRYGGTRPIVISYSSSPPFELVFAENPVDTLTTAAMTSDDSCFRQIEFVGILSGTPNRKLAEKWVDYMLSIEFQEDMPMQMYVFPVNSEAKLDETFTKYLKNPEKTSFVNPVDIASNRERWIQNWSETILR